MLGRAITSLLEHVAENELPKSNAEQCTGSFEPRFMGMLVMETLSMFTGNNILT